MEVEAWSPADYREVDQASKYSPKSKIDDTDWLMSAYGSNTYISTCKKYS